MTWPRGLPEGNGVPPIRRSLFMFIVLNSRMGEGLALDKNPRRVLVTPSESPTGWTNTVKGSQNGNRQGYPSESVTSDTGKNPFVANKRLTAAERLMGWTGP